MINGIDEVAITNLDGLDTLERIRVCVAYKLGRKTLEVPPSDNAQLAECVPIYEEFPGWQQPTHEAKSFADLPRKAQSYARKLAELSGAKLRIVSVGPNREQTIVIADR
jgi:adenylosuccinate synthase